MGELFGRYQLQQRIGAGGMAEVFVAKTFGAEGFVKDVVIKRILPAFCQDPEFVRMFINEARLAANLQHANIVQIYDFNHVDGVHYIAMEWVDGLDLRRIFQAAARRAMPIPQRMVVHVGVETLKGLHYAHTRSEGGQPLRLVHRDISPHNLLVSFGGEIKITDFGIAKAAALAGASNSAIKGKLAYMSPEQASNQLIDGRTDLFALGIVLWELLTGERLYHGASEAEVYSKVRQAEIQRPSERRPSIPVELEQVVMRMLAPLDQRYGSAAEVLGDLSRHADVADGLEVAAYLRLLLPAETSRGRREDTALAAGRAPESFAVASSSAPTHTVGAPRPPDPGEPPSSRDGTIDHDPRSDQHAAAWISPVAVETVSETGPTASPTGQTVPPVSRPRRPRWAIPAALLGAVVAAAGGWVIAGGGATRSSTPPSVASVRVETDPAGAQLWVDGIAVGKSPQTIYGRKGTVLELVATRDRIHVERRLELAEREQHLRLSLAAARHLPVDSGPYREDTTPARLDRGVLAPDRATVAVQAKATTKPRSKPVAPSIHKPQPRRARPDGSGLAEERGALKVVVSPWARVRVDGEEIGQTPLRHQLAAGSHRIEIYNSELGKREQIKIKIISGQETKIRRSWE
jgi:serine/threonine protein kinase